MKKEAFSLVELMIFMLFITLVLAASSPMITKRIREIPQRTSHGTFICYRDEDNTLRQATYNRSGQISSSVVESCVFNPPQRVVFYKVELIGGGAGGVNYYTRSDSYFPSRSFSYDPAKSEEALNNEFDNIAYLLPSNEVVYNMYLGENIFFNVIAPPGADGRKKEYNYYPTSPDTNKGVPSGFLCSMNTLSNQYFSTTSYPGGLLNISDSYTSIKEKNSPEDESVYSLNDYSNISENTTRLLDYLKTSDFKNLHETGARQSFTLSPQAKTFLNHLCYQYNLISDNKLKDKIDNSYTTTEFNEAIVFENGKPNLNSESISSDALFFEYVPTTTIFQEASGGSGGLLQHTVTITSEIITQDNAMEELRTILNENYQIGRCDTSGCTSGNFEKNIFPLKVSHTLDDSSILCNFFISTHLSQKPSCNNSSNDGRSPEHFAAIKTPNGYITNEKNATGGIAAKIYIDKPENIDNGVLVKFIEEEPINGEDAYGFIPNGTLNTSFTIGEYAPASQGIDKVYSGDNKIVYNNLGVRYDLKQREYNLGNGGKRGDYRKFELTYIPQNCSFNIGWGGKAIDSNTSGAINNETQEHPRKTTMTCPINENFSRIYETNGGDYNLELKKITFNPFEQIVNRLEQYIVEGDAEENSIYSQSPFNRSIDLPVIPFGQGGSPVRLTDSCTTVIGSVKYTLGEKQQSYSVNEEDSCINDESLVNITEAGSGIGGAIIITW